MADDPAWRAANGPRDALPDHIYRHLVEQAQVALFIAQGNRFLFVNPQLAALFGFSREEMLDGMDPLNLCAPEHRHRVRTQIGQRVEGVRGHAYEIEGLRKDGSRVSVQVWGVRTTLLGRTVDLVTMHDVGNVKQSAVLAERRAQLMSNAEELARIGSAEADLLTGTMTLSAGMCSIFGEPPSDLAVPREWFYSRLPTTERHYIEALCDEVAPGETFEFQHRIRHADGGLRTVLHRRLVEADEQGRAIRSVMLLQDVSDQKAAEQRLDRLANTDQITGLPNRHALMDRLESLVRHGGREQQDIALLGLRIDQLELVTESLGYAGSDMLLAAVAARVQEAVTPPQLLAHLGSGEYAVLAHNEDAATAQTAAELGHRILERLAAPLSIGDTEVKVTGAIGIALCAAEGQAPDKLLHQAQAAAYHARERGANQVCHYSADMHAKAASRLAMEAALRRALEHDEFHLVYQPKLDLGSGDVIGVEALLRWNAPEVTAASRVEFIRVAEETGLILPIGEWVLRRACAQAAAWKRQGLALRVAVNLSPLQVQQPDIVRRVQAILREAALEPALLGLEITEHALNEESAHLARALGELKSLGIEIALDDFGTGRSNLSYLRTLPIDVIKIDRSFVHDVTAAPQDVSITRAIITMAHSLQRRVLAEGVESEGQLALLVANHCDQMQGRYLSPPVAADEVAPFAQRGGHLPAHLLQRHQRQRTLLLVDDEDNILSALRRLLRRDGYRVVTASSGEQGLQALAEHPVDVIVTDQRMPGMTGVEFLRRAKELYPDTIRMVLSGYTELQSITDAVNEGAIYKFLTKPWDDERLRGHIAEAFALQEMAEENKRLGSAVIVANQELSQVNAQLQKLLASQQAQISREETHLVVARELLENVPAAVIGFDLDGMVAFMNAEAQALFPPGGNLLGCDAQDVLDPDLLRVWRACDGLQRAVQVGGRVFHAVCRAMDSTTQAQGRLMLLTPAFAAEQEELAP